MDEINRCHRCVIGLEIDHRKRTDITEECPHQKARFLHLITRQAFDSKLGVGGRLKQKHIQPVSMSTQNVDFLNVGRVQSGLFQPTFFPKALAY